jgi:hypothetical protein
LTKHAQLLKAWEKEEAKDNNNGISCQQQMSTATQFCGDWQELVLDVWNHDQTDISEAEILGRMEKYKNLLGNKLDVVYSTVRGVDGILPTEAEVV